jgi:ankyrin repeat protein
MIGIWKAARKNDVGEVERLVGHDLGLLDAQDHLRMTPLMLASVEGHMKVVSWLVDKGAALDEWDGYGHTALWVASWKGRTPVVRRGGPTPPSPT